VARTTRAVAAVNAAKPYRAAPQVSVVTGMGRGRAGGANAAARGTDTACLAPGTMLNRSFSGSAAPAQNNGAAV